MELPPRNKLVEIYMNDRFYGNGTRHSLETLIKIGDCNGTLKYSWKPIKK